MSVFDNPWIVVAGVIGLVIALVAFLASRSSLSDSQSNDGRNRGLQGRFNMLKPSPVKPEPGSRAPSFGVMPEGYAGVVHRLGKISKRVVKSGPYFRIPGVYRITVVSVQDMVVDMPLQNVPIEGGVSIGIEWSLVIQLTDPPTTLSLLLDYIQTVRELALQTGLETCRGLSLEKLWAQNDSMRDSLTESLGEQLSKYGVGVVSFAAVDYILSDSLKQATEQVIQARQDAEADKINAEREEMLAGILLKAAEKYVADGTSSKSKGEIALRLRELGTFEDMRGASVLVQSEQA